ncbi:hypothetical protein AK812_SmicGene36794 [Symbiodinium microadriaticum]|uniref:Uncharacterized protein n=1 Tax=Symbiodinium microadriaticum TaxID=2951 RepID=A0A1Q9CHY2_SYMMI|nr:hypothetical protein AK812_SmicGene36794 [Symbiodinium microadriaticum]
MLEFTVRSKKTRLFVGGGEDRSCDGKLRKKPSQLSEEALAAVAVGSLGSDPQNFGHLLLEAAAGEVLPPRGPGLLLLQLPEDGEDIEYSVEATILNPAEIAAPEAFQIASAQPAATSHRSPQNSSTLTPALLDMVETASFPITKGLALLSVATEEVLAPGGEVEPAFAGDVIRTIGVSKNQGVPVVLCDEGVGHIGIGQDLPKGAKLVKARSAAQPGLAMFPGPPLRPMAAF